MNITEPTSCAIRGRSDGDWQTSDHEQRLEIGGGISHSITSVAKDSYVFEPCILRMERTEEEKRRRHLYGDKGAKFRNGKQYEPMTDGCTRTITTFENDNLLMEQQVQNIPPKPELPGNWIWNAERQKWVRYRIRKLTPKECFRLMGVWDEWIAKLQSAGISESQQYKLAGNSIVVDVLFHIYTNLFIKTDKPEDTLF